MTFYHIPACPFCQRLEILLALKQRQDHINFQVVDITRPRPDALLAKTQGSTALPILEIADGRIIKESLVIMQYLEDVFPSPAVAEQDPYRRAVDNMRTRLEGDFASQGYAYILNANEGMLLYSEGGENIMPLVKKKLGIE